MLKFVDGRVLKQQSQQFSKEKLLNENYLQQQQVFVQEQQQETKRYAEVITTICFAEMNVVVFIL